MTARHKTWARTIGLLGGCGLAVAFVLSGSLPRVEERFGAKVKLVAGSAGELVATPPGTILAAHELHPGAEGRGSRGELRLFNPTEVPLTVDPIIAPAPSDLERVVHVSIRAGERKIFNGLLAELHGGAARTFRLRAGERQRLSFAVRLPASLELERYEAQTLEGRVEVRTQIQRR